MIEVLIALAIFCAIVMAEEKQHKQEDFEDHIEQVEDSISKQNHAKHYEYVD